MTGVQTCALPIYSSCSDTSGAMYGFERYILITTSKCLLRHSDSSYSFLWVLTLGLESKVPDCAELWCMDLCGFNHMMFMPSVHDADL